MKCFYSEITKDRTKTMRRAIEICQKSAKLQYKLPPTKLWCKEEHEEREEGL